MSLQSYFESENYLNLETGYPERNIEWFNTHILPLFKRFVTQKQRGLDVGCASGYFTKVLNNLLPFDGVDFTRNRIDFGVKLNPHLSLICADLTDTNLSNIISQRYDLFFTNAVIPHIPAAQKKTAYTNLASLALPGATFVMYDALKGVNDGQDATGVRDDFIGLFSVSWFEQNISEWKIEKITPVCQDTNEIILKLI